MSEEAAKNEALSNEEVEKETAPSEDVSMSSESTDAGTNEVKVTNENTEENPTEATEAAASVELVEVKAVEANPTEVAAVEVAAVEVPTDPLEVAPEGIVEEKGNELIAKEDSKEDSKETTAAEPAIESMSEIWAALAFPFKEQLSLNERNEIVLLGNSLRKEKIIAPFLTNTWESEVKKMSDHFAHLEKSATELQQQFEAAADPLKMRSAVRGLEHLISGTNAIGDFSAIAKQIESYKTAINTIYEANAATRLLLVEEAKGLVRSEAWQASTEQFKDIIDRWKVAPEVRKSVNESYWQAINEAKDAFFDNKRKHYGDQEKEQMVNLDRKMELCEKAAALEQSDKWKATTESLQQYLEEWKTIGQLPSLEKNEEMWSRFNGSRKIFFERKQAHSDTIKVEQEKNHVAKTQLVEEAESLSTSTDWKGTANRLAVLQKEWEALGRAPKEFNDLLWNRWKAALNTFYGAKREQAQSFVANLNENYDKKKVLTERSEHLAKSENWQLATEELLQLMVEWKTIGPVPKEKGDDLWHRFNDARKLFFKRKDADREQKKERYEQKAREKWSQAEQFMYTLQQELKDDEVQLSEFQESMNSLGDTNKKDKELKAHLATLIEKLEESIPKRKLKIAEVQQQMDKNNAAK